MMKAYLVGVVLLYPPTFIGPLPDSVERYRHFHIEFSRYKSLNLSVCYDRRKSLRETFKHYYHAFQCKGELQP